MLCLIGCLIRSDELSEVEKGEDQNDPSPL